MTQPPLYISFGMPKSGSTLAFELTRTMLELAGIAQVKISEGVTDPQTKINFVQKLDGPALDALLRDAEKLSGPIAIKTHSRVFPGIEEALREGRIIAQAVCRDPRDMALSMLDAAKDGRAWGKGPEGPLRTVADTEKRLRACVEMFQKWASLPNVIPIHYERVAFDTETVAAEIAAQIGIETDIPRAIEIATGQQFTQLNRGKSQRWKTEMDPADAKRLGAEFKKYIETYCSEIPAEPKPRKPPSRFFPKWLSRWR